MYILGVSVGVVVVGRMFFFKCKSNPKSLKPPITCKCATGHVSRWQKRPPPSLPRRLEKGSSSNLWSHTPPCVLITAIRIGRGQVRAQTQHPNNGNTDVYAISTNNNVRGIVKHATTKEGDQVARNVTYTLETD